MTESRFEKARRIAREEAPTRQEQRRRLADRLDECRRQVGPERAHRRVVSAAQGGELPYLGLIKTPHEWDEAVDIARLVTIGAVRQRTTITYGEIRHAIIEQLGHQVGHNQFADLVMSMNHESQEGILLSSIVVQKDTGRPGDGFYPYAKSQGIDEPLTTIHRRVFDHFGMR